MFEQTRECSICDRIERRRERRSKRKSGFYWSRREVANRRRLWKKYREHPEELRKIRWIEVLPDGSKRDGGLVWGSFGATKSIVMRHLTLEEFVVVGGEG